MKKLFALMAVMLLLAGCSEAEQRTKARPKQKYTQDDLIGKYVDFSYIDTYGVWADFLTQATPEAELVIEQGDSELVFYDSNFRGTCEWSKDGSVRLCREEIVSQLPGNDMIMEMQPSVPYFMYKDYLIGDWTMPIDEVDGDLPNGEYTYCSINFDHSAIQDYTLGFFEDGTCEIESTGVTGDSSEYFEGTYNFDGKIILLTITEGKMDGHELSGTCEMALYVDGGKVYSSVYKKIS